MIYRRCAPSAIAAASLLNMGNPYNSRTQLIIDVAVLFLNQEQLRVEADFRNAHDRAVDHGVR